MTQQLTIKATSARWLASLCLFAPGPWWMGCAETAQSVESPGGGTAGTMTARFSYWPVQRESDTVRLPASRRVAQPQPHFTYEH